MYDTESEPENEVLHATDSECEFDGNDQATLFQSDDEQVQVQSDEDHPICQPPLKRRKYSNRSSSTLTFLGKHVCQNAHLRLYAIGSSALQRLRAGQPAYTMHDNRLEEPKHQTLGVSLARAVDKQKWPNVLAFFWMLYMSAAEILPTKLTMPNNSNGLAESYVLSDPDFEERYIQAFMAKLERNYEHNPEHRQYLASFWNKHRFV